MSDMNVDAQQPELEFAVQRRGSSAIITVRGELDAYGAPELTERGTALLADGVRDIVVDLAETSFLDSSGLRAILTIQRWLDAEGSFAIRNPSDPVARLLEITGLNEHFEMRSTND